MKVIPFALSAALCLSACGGMGTAISEYGGVTPVSFSHAGSTWRVYDKPETGRLMITPTIGDSMASGFIGGATLGVAGDPITGRSAGIPQDKFSDAAVAWVTRHGSSCKLTKGHLLIMPQWEFFYSC